MIVQPQPLDIRSSLVHEEQVYTRNLGDTRLQPMWYLEILRFVRFRTYKRTQRNIAELECGPMPNVMVALPNIVGALCSTPQSLADVHY